MSLQRLAGSFLILYAILTLVPIVSIAVGLVPSPLLTPISTLAGFSFAMLHAGQREGWLRAFSLLAIIFLVSLVFELIGVATGFIYGPYHYTNKLGPLFLNLVPYLIPIAWFMMSYPSYVIADRLVPPGWKSWQRRLSMAALGGLAMTAWDLLMDPIMVAGGYWIWDTQGAYFGIPLKNFLGWWITVFTSFVLYQLLSSKMSTIKRTGFDRLAILSYLVTMLGVIFVSLVIRAGELAVIGLFAMAPWAVTGWLSLEKTTT